MNLDHIDQKWQDYIAFPAEQRRLIDKELKIDGLETENNLENNSLTRSEISILLKTGLTIGGKPFLDHLETLNHADAYAWIDSQTDRTLDSLDVRDIFYIHLLVSKGIEIQAGRLRTDDIKIAPTETPRPAAEKLPQLMNKLIAWLHMSREQHPIDIAIEAHYRLLLMSPFQHRNGRVARLFMNIILQMQNYPICLMNPKDLTQYTASIRSIQKMGHMNEANKEIMISAIEYSLDIRLKILKDLNDSSEGSGTGELLKIGELAKAIGEANSTIRYWMKKGLLYPTKTLPSGYQLFDQTALIQAKHIQDLKTQRYTLSEIKTLIESSDS